MCRLRLLVCGTFLAMSLPIDDVFHSNPGKGQFMPPVSRRSTLPEEENEKLLTPAEVAGLFRVDPKTVARWANSGRLTSIRTPGGHRRFRESQVRALLRSEQEGADS